MVAVCHALVLILALLLDSSKLAAGEPSFVGSAACAGCHADQTTAWADSHHGWALREPTDASVLGDFNNTKFEHKGITSRFFKKAGGFFIETDNASGKLEVFAVRYTVGIAPLQQYLVETDNGRLQTIDIAWDTEQLKWFHLYPDQDMAAGNGLHWTGTYKNWQSRCAECHQTGFDKGFDPKAGNFNTQWAELTVSCESCHGPSSEHVGWARQTPRMSPAPSMLKLGAGQQANELAACGPCHARREAFTQKSAPVAAPFGNHYNLSLLTPDLYFADGQQNAEVFILGSFLQSKMMAKGVTCSNCHEPHSGKLVVEGNGVCTQCHSAAGNASFPSVALEDYDSEAHHHHKPDTEGALCVSCHMPDRAYMVNDRRRDHFFRIPDPLQSKAASAPDACTSCHTDQTEDWSAARIAEWQPTADLRWQDRSAFVAFDSGDRSEKAIEALAAYARDIDRPSIMRATAAATLRDSASVTLKQSLAPLLADRSDLVRAAAAGLLRQSDPALKIEKLVPLLFDSTRAVRHAAAIELVASDPALLDDATRHGLGLAIREYMDSRAANAEMPEAHMALGGLALGMRRWNEAEAAFAQATTLDPQLEQAWLMLTRIRAALGDDPGADQYLESALARLPNSIQLLIERAGLESRRGSDARAIDWYRRALALDMENADAWFQLGATALRAQNPALAIDAARRAMALQPDNADANVLAAVGHYQLGDMAEAKEYALKSRQLAPDLQLPAELEKLIGG